MAATVAITIGVVLDVEAGKTTQHKGTGLVAGIEAELVPGASRFSRS